MHQQTLQNSHHNTKKAGIGYTMTAFELRAGESARVAKINITGSAKERLISLGVTSGAEITSLGFSLFKSSVLIGCGAVRVAVRRALAQKIEVAV